MVRLSRKAERQLAALTEYYELRDRPEATRTLAAAVERADKRVGDPAFAGLQAPRPYPSLAAAGRLWIKEGRYWFCYSAGPNPVILGIYHEAADIPRRL